MATKLSKPVAREVMLPTGTPRVVTLTEHGVQIRLKRHRRGVFVPYDLLERFDPQHSVIVGTQHWGELRVSLNTAGVMYQQVGTKRKALIAMLPHGVAFQRAVDLLVAAERAAKKAGKGAARKRR
jgi:hypothetical protein